MIEENIGEQPKEIDDNVQKEIVNDGTALNSNDGSLGKFKDTESLLSAYNNLQAEFTRKCQKLGEVTKELNELKEPAKSENEAFVFDKDNWSEQVSSFLLKNAKAKEYSGEIANEILQDKNLQSSPNALELAWARVMEREFTSPKYLANDKKFIDEQILTRQDVREQVINEYFKNLQKIKNPPVISNSGNVAFSGEVEPKNMAEAKKMVEQLFNLKG